MKPLTLSLSSAFAGSLPGVERDTAKFLQALEGGKPLETMTPADARCSHSTFAIDDLGFRVVRSLDPSC